jgi:prepilin signal peptidase PulO-like enzyme (type II secretory pathway)
MDPVLFYQVVMFGLITCVGLVVGSFLNVCIYRIPEKRTVVKGHSMCMSCGHDLGPLDLVPLFSWLFLRGKCRYCKAPIASRYAIIEATTAIVFGSLTWQRRDYIPIPYVSAGFPWNAFLLALLLVLAAVMIVCMMIWKDKQEIGISAAVTIFVIFGLRLLLAFTRSGSILTELTLSAIAFLASCLLVFLFALLVPYEKNSFRDSLRNCVTGRNFRAYFSGSKRGIFTLDMIFIALCSTIGIPVAFPLMLLYSVCRFLFTSRPAIRYLGIIMAAGGFAGILLFPFWLY